MFGKSSGKKAMKWASLLKDFKEKVGLTQSPTPAASPSPSSSPFTESTSSDNVDNEMRSQDFWSSSSSSRFSLSGDSSSLIQY